MQWFAQELESQCQGIRADQPAQRAAIEGRIAELMQLTDPQQLAAAMAALSEAIRASSEAAETVRVCTCLSLQSSMLFDD